MAVGFDAKRLERIGQHADRYVASGRFPGYAVLVSRGGEEAYFRSDGLMDVERNRAVARDTVFRIYSMTKPITSVALMMLYERGYFQLDDPVARYIPQWSDLAVFDEGDAKRFTVREPTRPMTIKDLFTHTSGLTYAFHNAHPVDALYRSRQLGELEASGLSLADLVDRLADIPLQFSPGSRWNYGVSTDVLGYLVQVFSGQDLDTFIGDEITRPLGMTDTGFAVRDAAQDRFAACYRRTEDDRFQAQDDPLTSRYLNRPTFLSGGGGMVASIDDYHRFARMMLGGGILDGQRILGRKTVEYMTTNHMPGNGDLAGMGQPVFSETSYEGIGFGLGYSVVLDPAAANVLDSVGEFAWGGAASTYHWARSSRTDPAVR